MNEEVKRVVDALKLPVWGEAVRVVNDRLSTAALFIENLAAETERLTARCEAAERDIEVLLQDGGSCDRGAHFQTTNCEVKSDTYCNAKRRGPREENQ